MSKSTNRPIILRIQSQKKLREIKLIKLSTEIEKNHLCTYEGLREGEIYS